MQAVHDCNCGNSMYFQILTTDTESEYIALDIKRRCVTVGSENVILEQVNKVDYW